MIFFILLFHHYSVFLLNCYCFSNTKLLKCVILLTLLNISCRLAIFALLLHIQCVRHSQTVDIKHMAPTLLQLLSAVEVHALIYL